MTAPLKITDLDQFRTRGPFPLGYPEDRRTFYSPVDDVHGAAMAVINSAVESLFLAMYGYDDDDLHQVILGKMSDPNILVVIALDSSQAAGKHEQELVGAWLDPNTPTPRTHLISVGRSELGAIMHEKQAVVDGLWVISGSTNWSTSGESKQDNQLTITCNWPEGHLALIRILQIHLDQLQKAAAKEAAHARR